jgi:hypothetical protein
MRLERKLLFLGCHNYRIRMEFMNVVKRDLEEISNQSLVVTPHADARAALQL